MRSSHWLIALHLIALGAVSNKAAAELSLGVEAYDRADYAEALAELAAPDTAHEPRAQFLMGLMHANGQGVPRDHQEALRLFRRAHAQGFAPAGEALAALGSPPDSSPAFIPAGGSASSSLHTMAGATGSVVLQIGSFSSALQAERSWREVQSAAPELTEDIGAAFPTKVLRGTTFHRVQIGPFASPQAAKTRCGALKAHGALAECFAVRSP